MTTATAPLRVLLPCTGLGRERRGFETFTRGFARAMDGEPGLHVQVLAGGRDTTADAARDVVIPSLRRSGGVARALGGLLRRDPYFVEQGSFFIAMLPTLMRFDPQVVYFADLNLGNALWHWRRMTRAKYRMLFYNGGATRMPFTRCDHVQQVVPSRLEEAKARGESPARQTVLPHAVEIVREHVPVSAESRAAARRALGVPADGNLLLSVGQLDRATKRMDLLIESVEAMGAGRPYLLIAGADGPDGASLRALAASRLGDRWRWVTLPPERMPEAYRAANAFALLSRGEGFGIAYVEALAAGLAVLAHDEAVTRYVTGGQAILRSVDDPTSGAHALAELLAAPTDRASAAARHASVRDRFGWDALRPSYVALLQAVAAGTSDD